MQTNPSAMIHCPAISIICLCAEALLIDVFMLCRVIRMDANEPGTQGERVVFCSSCQHYSTLYIIPSGISYPEGYISTS